MKILKYTYLFTLAAMVAAMAACSSDEDAAGSEQRADGKVPVRLHLRVAGQDNASQMKTRAVWNDVNATDDEMMNVWTVVAVHADGANSGKVAFIHASMPADDKREIDDLVYLEPGKYDFYNFANMEPTVATAKLGINTTGTTLAPVRTNGTIGAATAMPTGFFSNFATGYAGPLDINGVYSLTWTGDPTVSYTNVYNNTKVTVNGNGFDPTAADNGFSSKGIPMSNLQQITVAEETDVDLIVVRMLAKIEVQLFNESATPITVKSATLTDVTTNGQEKLFLLPNLSYHDDMNFHHKDIQPHLDNTAAVSGYTYTPTTSVTVPAEYDYTTNKANPAHKLTFYVNESNAPTHGSGLFFLALGIDKGGSEVEYHHALINQKGSTTDDDDAWDYIARNDYRVIPIVLTDWLFRIEPIAYAPIGGYPTATLSSDALTATFSTGGPIILQPFVKKKTDATWRDFTDPEINNVTVTWKNSDGTNASGTGMIIESALTYDAATQSIYGTLSNSKGSGTYKTEVTVTATLGPTTGDHFPYSFTFNIVLEIP